MAILVSAAFGETPLGWVAGALAGVANNIFSNTNNLWTTNRRYVWIGFGYYILPVLFAREKMQIKIERFARPSNWVVWSTWK